MPFQVQFEKDARTRYLQLLGYDQTDLSKKVAEVTGSSSLKEKAGVSADELADKMSMLNAVSRKECCFDCNFKCSEYLLLNYKLSCYISSVFTFEFENLIGFYVPSNSNNEEVTCISFRKYKKKEN